MAVQYSPLPEFQTPNVNLLGAYAQGQALQQNALQQQRLAQQMQLAELSAGYTANKDLREAAKLQAEQQSKEFEMASKKYDLLVGMSPRLTPDNYKAWYKEVTTAFPPAASVLNPEYDPEQVRMIPLQAADMKPQLLQQTIGGQTRLLRAGPTGPAEVVPGSEMSTEEFDPIKGPNETIVGYKSKYGAKVVSPEEFQNMSTMNYIGQREGTGKNPLSSAQGPGQFTDGTFIDTYRKTFPDQARRMTPQQILAQRGASVNGAPVEQSMLQTFTTNNQQRLRDAGFEPSKSNTYLAHFAGPDGAIDVLSASPDTPVTDLLSPKAIKSNPEVFNKVKTAGDLIKWAGGSGSMQKVEGLREPLQSYRPAAIGTEEAADQKSALKFLNAIEYDPETGNTRPGTLLESAGGGRPTQILYGLARALGVSTAGTRAEAGLSSSQINSLLAKVGSLGGKSFTDEDRKVVMEGLGGLENTAVPIGDRLAKFDEAIRLMANTAGVPYKTAPQMARLQGIATQRGTAGTPTTRGRAGGEDMVVIDIPGQGPHRFPANVADKVRAAIAARGGR